MKSTPATGSALREVARLYLRAQRTELACCGSASSVQGSALIEILRNEGMTQQALVQRLALDKGWISRAVDAMVQDGTVVKIPSETDRRSVALGLTAQGLVRALKLEQTLNEHAEHLLHGIAPDEQATIRMSLQLLQGALQRDRTGAEKLPRATWAELRDARLSDWPAIAALLTARYLPLDGALDHLDRFVVIVDGEDTVGAGGLEIYGEHALLRSVAVAEGARNTGLGKRLVTRLAEKARRHGVTHLYLLTTNAEQYFIKLGFGELARADVPASIGQSRQFHGACPASATAMVLPLNLPDTL
jgi:amino-acid N-acetyltransferase